MRSMERSGRSTGQRHRREIRQFIRDFVERHGYPPTLREIGGAVGLATSTVSYHLSILERHGHMTRGAGLPRTAVEPVRQDTQPSASEVEVPLIGRIAAGRPIFAEQSVEDTYRLPRRLVGEGPLFMLQVTGDSMINAAIADGDLVVIRQQPVAENGEIIAALLDSTEAEATVKTLQRSDGRIWLMPQNASYTPIPGDEATILGRVVAVLRRV
jgi:repressor LexA